MLHVRNSCLKLCLWEGQVCSVPEWPESSRTKGYYFSLAPQEGASTCLFTLLILVQWHKFWISVLWVYKKISLICFKLWVLNGLLYSDRQNIEVLVVWLWKTVVSQRRGWFWHSGALPLGEIAFHGSFTVQFHICLLLIRDDIHFYTLNWLLLLWSLFVERNKTKQ